MSDLVVGALLGVGAFCVWWSCWVRDPWPHDPRTRPVRRRRVRELLDAAGMTAVPSTVPVALTLVLSLAPAVAVVALTNVPVLGAGVLVLVPAAAVSWLRSRARRRHQVSAASWPDAVDALAAAVRAGSSLPDALGSLAGRGPEHLRPAFTRFATAHRASGAFESELDRLRDELADPVFDRLSATLRMTRQVGGSDLGQTLRTFSGHLRTERRTRGELQARQSLTVSAARLAVAAPWIVLGLLATRPGTLDAFRDLTGSVILVAAAVVTVAAYRVMLRLGRLPEPRRVLS